MNLDIVGNKVLLVGNRGHKNMGDELILLGNIKLLLKQGKKIYIACSNKEWLINFHKQFFKQLKVNKSGFENENREQIITYLQELPKGFRSTLKLLKNIKDIKKYFEVDSILVGGGEILTEETAGSYFYWFFSIWILLPFKKLYLSGGIQVPKKFWNKLIFNILTKKAEKIYTRDNDLQKNSNLSENIKNKLKFFPDTSIFVYDDIDLENYKWKIKSEKKDIIIININRKAEQFYEKIYDITKKYYNEAKHIYFVRVCKSPADDDIVYYHKLKKEFPGLKLLDWESWNDFINILSQSEKVYTTRLHLFLISHYLNLDVVPFVYQKKVEKMKKVLNLK